MKFFYPSILPAFLLLAFLLCTLQGRTQSVTDTTASLDSANITENFSQDSSDVKHFTLKSEDDRDYHTVTRTVPVRVTDSMKKLDAFWYADEVFKKKKLEDQQQTRNRPFLRISDNLFWTIVIIVFGAGLIFFLVQSNIFIFGRRNRQVEASAGDGEEEKNIFEIPYEDEIKKAAREENYRLAIRLMFLRLLTQLSDRNIIEYKQDRTNFEYLTQLYKTNYYSSFFRLTRNYEYAWYGKFHIAPTAYEKIREEFEQFEKRLY
jgi:hypothetical protein